MEMSLVIVAGAVMAFTAVAMVMDLKTRLLPNWLTVGMAALGLAFHGVLEGWPGLQLAAGGFAVGFGVLLLLWLIGGSGGGDVKLMAALGAWLGPALIIIVFVASAVFALIGSVATAAMRWLWGRAPATAEHSAAGVQAPAAAGPSGDSGNLLMQPIPYAAPVALATWCVMILKVAAAIIVRN